MSLDYPSYEHGWWNHPWHTSTVSHLEKRLTSQKCVPFSSIKKGKYYVFYKIEKVWSTADSGAAYWRRHVTRCIAKVEFRGNPVSKKKLDWRLKNRIKYLPELYKGKNIIYTNVDSKDPYRPDVLLRTLFEDDYGETVYAFPYDGSPTDKQKSLVLKAKALDKQQEKLEDAVYKVKRKYNKLNSEFLKLEEEKWTQA